MEGPARKKEARKLGLRRRKSKRVLYALALLIVVALGIGSYGVYYVVAHPSGPYGTLPYPCGTGTQAQHVHPYLSIVINGQNVSVPADIGIIGGGSCLEAVHTHDASGIIHIEASDTSTSYTLGNFFQIWGATYGSVTIGGTPHPIIFNSTDILGFKEDQNHKVTLLVDGQPSAEWGALVLNRLDYCNANSTGPPCGQSARGDPYWNGAKYPYGTGHTIVIEYVATSG